jgi:hypothetical protein
MKLAVVCKAYARDIDFIIGRTHVGASDDDVAAEFRRRTKTMDKKLSEQIVRCAIKAHHKNQGFYDDVMRGRIGRKR